MAYSQLAAYVHSKSVIINHINPIYKASYALIDDIYLLLIGKESTLVLVKTYGHGDRIEHRKRAAQNIVVTRRKGVERTRKKSLGVHF